MNVDSNTKMDPTKKESKRLLRTLELKAFRGVVDALRAQGSFNSQKCTVLKKLASSLKVGDERCRSEMRRAGNDNLLNYIAQCSEEENSDENWHLESARKVARVPMINEPTIFTALADKVSDWVVSHNQTVENDSSLMEILESKKCRTDANASRYHTTKLFGSLLPTSLRMSGDIAIELDKIKSHSKRPNNHINIPRTECLSIPKPIDVPLSVEIPPTTNEVVESNIIIVPSDDEGDHNKDLNNDVPISNSLPSKDVPVKANVPNKSRLAKSRKKPWQKRPPAKTCTLQEELGRTVNAMDALVSPETEQSQGCKPSDDNHNSVAAVDDWQPKEKKMKNDIAEKVPSDVSADRRKSVVSVSERKSLIAQDSVKNVSFSASYCPANDAFTSSSLEMRSQSLKSNVKSVQEDAELPVEKDFTPHTFNLIPASRRLKMVKKPENPKITSVPKEPESVAPVNRQTQITAPLTSVESNLSKKSEPMVQSATTNKSALINSVPSVAVNTGNVVPKEPESDRKKEVNEKLKNVLPVINQKKTLSLLGNIKVRNLNMTDEFAEDSCSSYEDRDDEELLVEDEEETEESLFERSDIDSSGTDDSQFSNFSCSDSHSVIEYWDHDDDEDIISDGRHTANIKNSMGKSNFFDAKNATGDDIRRHHRDLACDEGSLNSDFSDEIVEEIIEGVEFYSSDGAESYDSDDTEESVIEKSSRNGGEICQKPQSGLSVDKSTVQKSETESTMSDASASGASYNNHTSMGNSSSDVSNVQKNYVNPETGLLNKLEPLAAGSAVSILKLKKPVVIGTSAALPQGKEVVLVSPKLQKPIPVTVTSDNSAAATTKCSMITPSKCIVRGQTISLTNARLITAAPKTNQSTSISNRQSTSTAELPKITLYSTAKLPNTGGLQLSSTAKRIILPQSTKISHAGTSLKPAPLKAPTASIPKKVCRLYDLMDVSDSTYNSSSIHMVKKNLPNKKTAVDVSST